MTIITKAFILGELESIRKHEGDDEAQHSREDELYRRVLVAISKNKLEDMTPAEASKLILETQKMKFNRWAA